MLGKKSGQAIQGPRPEIKQSHRTGQALVELLPSLVIFFMVLSASLAYFRILRAATIRQEAVRNLIFAKIGNSGTLTTPTDQMGNTGISFANFLNDQSVITKSRNEVITSSDPCFSVNPKEITTKLEPTRIFGIGIMSDAAVSVSSFAAIYRYPNGQCP